MYSRKQTLLLTGSAVALPVRGEDTRVVALQLISTYLGITGINKGDISACHRLKNPKVILVRFSHMDDSDRIYRARTKPKRRGLLIFESLTTERLSVIEMIKALKNDNSSPVLSYFTQAGKIFIRTSESRDVKPIEIPFGCGPEQIRELCAGRAVNPPEVAIRDQFRAVHGRGSAGGPDLVGSGSRGGAWVTVGRGRVRDNRGPPHKSAQPSQVQAVSAGGGRPVGSHPGGGLSGASGVLLLVELMVSLAVECLRELTLILLDCLRVGLRRGLQLFLRRRGQSAQLILRGSFSGPCSLQPDCRPGPRYIFGGCPCSAGWFH